MIERETSLRRVLEVMRHPAVAPYFERAQKPGFVPPCGDAAYYLKLGRGFIAYLVHEHLTEMHGCLLPGDVGAGAISQVREQFEYLFERGVKLIRTAHPKEHKRASAMCRALGMAKNEAFSADELNVYEVSNG